MRKLTIILSLLCLSLILVLPSHAGRIKALLLDTEEMIHAEMSVLGDYDISIEDPEITSNDKGILVIATVHALDNFTKRSSTYICEVQFEGPVGQFEPTGVRCY